MTLNDFEWLEWPFYDYELPLAHYLLLIYCRLFITRDVTTDQRTSA